MELQLCRDSLLFPSPPPSRRGTPCNSPELSPFGSECLGEAGQKITLLEDPHITSPDKAKGGRRSSARRTPDL
ncbi:uncharacterized [Tachysurus ichikawai]